MPYHVRHAASCLALAIILGSAPVLARDEAVAPQITSLSSVSAFDWSRRSFEPIEATVTKIILGFSKPMIGLDLPSNWLLVSAGPNGVRDTNACDEPGGDDVAVSFYAVDTEGPQLVALSPYPTTGLPSGRYRLFACPTLTDGTNALAEPPIDFEVAVDPELGDPNINNAVQPGPYWSSDPELAWSISGIDAEGEDTYSTSLVLYTSSGANATWRLQQCLPVRGPTTASASALVRIDSDTALAPTVRVSYGFTSAADCSGPSNEVLSQEHLSGNQSGAWSELFARPVEIPPEAVAFRLGLRVDGGDASEYRVYVDRVRYPATETVFKSGFE